MTFAERLREKRLAANLTQVELAKAAGVTSRTIQHYELGERKPSNMEIVQKIADALGTTASMLLGGADAYVVSARERGGAAAARDIESLVGEVAGLFAGGELDDAALDGAMRALNEAYWTAKEKNKKYGRKRASGKRTEKNGK